MTSTFQNITREELVLRKIFDDPIIQDKVLPHLNSELFIDDDNKAICIAILNTYKRLKKFPQGIDLSVGLPDNSTERNRLIKIMSYKIDDLDTELSIKTIENFFKHRKTELILMDAAESINKKDIKNIAALTKKLEESTSFSLNTDIGLDLVEDTEEALRRLNETQTPVPSSLYDIRYWTRTEKNEGGWYRKALSVFQGMPNVGKTTMLCNEAAYAYSNGYNVLYVSLEMAEEHIWQKIASNISDISIMKITTQPKEDIEKLLITNKVKENGSITVRQLPSTTTALDIDNLINEVKLTKGYATDIIFVDYIGKMKSDNIVGGLSHLNTYTRGTAVAEQLRDLAIKFNAAVVTATQVNRDGYSNLTADMKNTADSAGINDTADIMITIGQDQMLESFGMLLHTIIKSRFGPKLKTFVSECDYEHMRIRSASKEKMQLYSDAQINQTPISDFNQSPVMVREEKEYIERKPSKEAQEKAKEKLRFNSIKNKYGTENTSDSDSSTNDLNSQKINTENGKENEIIDKKEHILDNKNTNSKSIWNNISKNKNNGN